MTGRGGDRGSALVEFLVVGVAVLVPVAYLALAATTVQAEVLAGTQAVREAGRAFSMSATVAEGRSRAVAAARLAFLDHGLDLPADGLRIACVGGPCLAPGSSVDVRLAWSVPLPWVPVGGIAEPALPLSAEHLVPIDDYRQQQRHDEDRLDERASAVGTAHVTEP